MISDKELIQEYNPVTKRTWIKFVMAISLFFIPLAPAFAYFFIIIKDFLYGLKSLSWNEAQGVILVSALDGVSSKNDVPNHEIYYEYTVDQKEYTGWRKKFGGGESSSTIWDEVEKFRRGDIVTIYYNPNNPQESTLIRGVQWSNFLMIIFIPLITLFQLIFFAIIHVTLWDLSWLFFWT